MPFVNLPLRQSPNACAGDCRGISDPVVPYKPPRLTAHLTCSNLAPRSCQHDFNCNGEIQPACDLRATAAAAGSRYDVGTDRLGGAGCVAATNKNRGGQQLRETKKEEQFRTAQ